MNLKNKTLALVVASALVMPSALAVEGSDGMHYTSASEGFYTSIRVRFSSGTTDGDNAQIQNSSSRLGVRGSSEMSHGLEGFYNYEVGFEPENGSGLSTRMAHVGLRGGFGSLAVGTNWTDEYNFVVGNTDIANTGGGNFAYSDSYGKGRADRSVFYKSPDFNGLQVAARFELDGDNDKKAADPEWVCASPATVVKDSAGNSFCSDNSEITNAKKDEMVDTNDSELDAWALSAKYAFNGFTLGGMYLTRPDYINAYTDMGGTMQNLEDLSAWALRGSYGQDNWGVSAWYGENNVGDFGYHVENPGGAADPDKDFKKQNETVFSIAGNVTVGPSGVYVIHETQENLKGEDDAYTTFGVEYKFNSKAKTWIEYNAQDAESDDSKEDHVSIGLRHDF